MKHRITEVFWSILGLREEVYSNKNTLAVVCDSGNIDIYEEVEGLST
jgi:hypothetical protein